MWLLNECVFYVQAKTGLFDYSSSTCFLQQDGRVSNFSPYHVISIQPPSLISMDDLQFDRHALSLYRFYRERGCLVTFQLWTTEDGGEHFKISRPSSLPFHPPNLPFRPAPKLFPSGIPLSPKTRKSPGRQRRDQRRLEQHRAAKHQRNIVMGDEVVLKYTGTRKRTSVVFKLILENLFHIICKNFISLHFSQVIVVNDNHLNI